MTDGERRALRGRVADAVRDIAWYGTEPPAAFDDQRAGLHRKVASALAVTGLMDRRGFPGTRVRCALACAEARASIAEAGRLHDMAGDVPGWSCIPDGVSDSLRSPMDCVVDEVVAAM